MPAQDALRSRHPPLELIDPSLVGVDLLGEGGGLQVGLLEGDGQGVHLGRAGLDLGLGGADLGSGGPDGVGAGGLNRGDQGRAKADNGHTRAGHRPLHETAPPVPQQRLRSQELRDELQDGGRP